MITLTLIFQAIIAVLNFPAAMAAFIKLVSKTPAEKQADIVAQVNAMIDASESSPDGRPKWDK
jgi:hypothetical protein